MHRFILLYLKYTHTSDVILYYRNTYLAIISIYNLTNDINLKQGLAGQSNKKHDNSNYLQQSRPHKYNRKKSRLPFIEDREELLQNPMLDPDIDKVDFSNPMFDRRKALMRDAAVTIQSWYRMWRERIPFLQKREAALIIQVSQQFV